MAGQRHTPRSAYSASTPSRPSSAVPGNRNRKVTIGHTNRSITPRSDGHTPRRPLSARGPKHDTADMQDRGNDRRASTRPQSARGPRTSDRARDSPTRPGSAYWVGVPLEQPVDDDFYDNDTRRTAATATSRSELTHLRQKEKSREIWDAQKRLEAQESKRMAEARRWGLKGVKPGPMEGYVMANCLQDAPPATCGITRQLLVDRRKKEDRKMSEKVGNNAPWPPKVSAKARELHPFINTHRDHDNQRTARFSSRKELLDDRRKKLFGGVVAWNQMMGKPSCKDAQARPILNEIVPVEKPRTATALFRTRREAIRNQQASSYDTYNATQPSLVISPQRWQEIKAHV